MSNLLGYNMRLVNLWCENYGEVYIPVDKILMVHEDDQGFGVLILDNGMTIVTSSELNEIVHELTTQGVFECRATQSQ